MVRLYEALLSTFTLTCATRFIGASHLELGVISAGINAHPMIMQLNIVAGVQWSRQCDGLINSAVNYYPVPTEYVI